LYAYAYTEDVTKFQVIRCIFTFFSLLYAWDHSLKNILSCILMRVFEDVTAAERLCSHSNPDSPINPQFWNSGPTCTL